MLPEALRMLKQSEGEFRLMSSPYKVLHEVVMCLACQRLLVKTVCLLAQKFVTEHTIRVSQQPENVAPSEF